MTLAVTLWPDPVLSRVAQPVTVFDAALADLARDMLAAMYAAPGRGLAAPQVSVSKRLFVMDCTWKEGRPDPMVLVNPQIVARSAELLTNEEGCLSLPGFTLPVARPAGVRMRWQDLGGAWHEADFQGFAAICVQHEHDHLDGILTLDRTTPEALAEAAPALARLDAAP